MVPDDPLDRSLVTEQLSSDDEAGDDQPLLASASRGGEISPRSYSDCDATYTASSKPAWSARTASVICLTLCLLLLLLPLTLTFLLPGLGLSSCPVSADQQIDSLYFQLLWRGCEAAHISWQFVHGSASAWSLTSISGPTLPAVDPHRLELAHCLVYAINVPSSVSTSSSSAAVHCPASPASIVSTFFPSYLQLYPSVLTHSPPFSCDRGTYLWVDWQYTDGMGNSLWAYSVILSLAMAINATILAFPFVATHVENESHEERQRYFAFDEWEVHRSQWEKCSANSSVKLNQFTLPRITSEYSATDPTLLEVRQWMRDVQVKQAAAANTTHLHASLTDTSSYRYMNPQFTYESVSLPRVDNDGPGLTVHLKAQGIDGPWTLGMFAPGVEVTKVNEIRWIAQQLHWRRHTHPVEPSATSNTATASTATVDSSSSPSESNSSSPTAVWLTSDDIHVAIPVRRGDVSGNTAGGQLLISIDMRSRVMTDVAIAHLLNQTITIVRSITANTTAAQSLPLPNASVSSFPVTYQPSPLAGQDIVSRMIFTIYSEGPPDGFTTITDSLRFAGIDPSRIRLRLNEKTSRTFTLLANSDLILLSPSSFSYAAACYFNSEGVHIGSGWTFNRFAGCHNFVYAQWRRYIINADEVKQGEKYIPAEDVSTPQWWGVDDEAAVELRRRVERLVARKERQRWSVEPIVLDNFREDYPRRWMFDGDRPEMMVELHAPRVERDNTTTTAR